MIELKKETEDQKLVKDLLKSRDWLSKNLNEVQNKYSEKWVAIAEEKIITYGDNVESVRKEVEKLQAKGKVLIIRIPRGEISKPI